MKDGKYKTGCQMCHGGCGIIVHIKNGCAVKIEPDLDCPNNRGYLCVRGRASLDYIYHPNRLKYPLIRVGDRGSGKWQEIPWDKATDIIAEKLTQISEENGPQSVAMAVGTLSHQVNQAASMFARYFGTPNICGAGHAQCFIPRELSSKYTYGTWLFPDFEGGCKLVVMWGAQTHITSPDHYTASRLFYALKQGAKLILVDPRRTSIANRADIWQPLRPGSDAALLLAWLNVIINENLYDRDFVEQWTNAPYLVRQDTGRLLLESDVISNGSPASFMIWDLLAGYAVKANTQNTKSALTGDYKVNGILCRPVWQELINRVNHYPPEEVADICWIKPEEIRRAARMYAQNHPAILLWGVAVDQLVGSHQITRAICILESICGNVDIQGGMADMRPAQLWDGRRLGGGEKAWKAISPECRDMILGGKEYRLLADANLAHIPSLKKAVLKGEPYLVRALLIWGSNPLISWANTPSTYQVLKQVEFSVVYDFFLTPTAQMADLVLPGASFLEKNRISQGLTNNKCILFIPKLIEPYGESRDEFDVAGEILKKCGRGNLWPWVSAEDFLEEELRRVGLSWREYKYKGWYEGKPKYEKYKTNYYREGGGFNTESGKVELFCNKWQKLGYDPLPNYKEQPETPFSRPDLNTAYPYILITGGRVPMFFHSQFREVDRLRKLHPDPIVQIHPNTAKKLNISEGDWVYIETRRGRCYQKAKLFDGMDSRIVHIEHHWWFPEEEKGEPNLSGAFRSNSNMLTAVDKEFLDPAFGGYCLKALMCNIYKAEPFSTGSTYSSDFSASENKR